MKIKKRSVSTIWIGCLFIISLLFCFYKYSLNVSAAVSTEIVSKNLSTNAISRYYVTSSSKSAGDISPGFNGMLPESRAIIGGSDERHRIFNTTASPYRFIGVTRFTWSNGDTEWGTASLIGRDLIVTSAHCAFVDDGRGWITKVRFYPGKNSSSAPYGNVDGISVDIPQSWIDQGGAANDVALIRLAKPIGDQVGYFGFAKGDHTGETVSVTGYPGADSSTQVTIPYTMWSMDGPIVKSSTNVIAYKMDTTGGQSGAPVYTWDNFIVGIHSRLNEAKTSNYAKRITDWTYTWFLMLK